MKVVYVIYRDGKPFFYFGDKQVAMDCIAACLDLDPGSVWKLLTKEVSGDA